MTMERISGVSDIAWEEVFNRRAFDVFLDKEMIAWIASEIGSNPGYVRRVIGGMHEYAARREGEESPSLGDAILFLLHKDKNFILNHIPGVGLVSYPSFEGLKKALDGYTGGES